MNFLKGVIGGIGNIIPGLSGSALLIILNIYDKCLLSISNIFNNFKKSILYLFPIGLGILIGTFLFSNIIEYALNNYLMVTSITFIGFMIGTIPTLFKKATIQGFKDSYLIPFFITFILGAILLTYKSDIIINKTDYNFLDLILSGVVIACSTIIPGISSTVLLTIIGQYNTYINAINNLNINILFPISMGFIISAYFLSKFISYMLKKHYGYTYFAIIGFTISTIPSLIMTDLFICSDLFIGIILGIISFIITNHTLNYSN